MAAPTLVTATIPAGETLSNAVDLSAGRPLRCRMPPAWTPGGTDVVTFQCASAATGPWMDMYSRDGKPWWSMVVVPNAVVPIEADFGAKIVDTFIKVKASVPQTVDRVFTFVTG